MGVIPVEPAHPLYAFLKLEAEAAEAEKPAPMFYAHGETIKYIVGVDLGQSSDPTAIAVLRYAQGIIDHGNSFERHVGISRQTKCERCDVVHLERLPLGMSYPAQVDHVKQLLARPPLCG